MEKAVFLYFITLKGEQKYNKTKRVPGGMIWHFSRSARALWVLKKQGVGGGTAKYLSSWIEPMETEATERTLNRLVAKGLAMRRKLKCL